VFDVDRAAQHFSEISREGSRRENCFVGIHSRFFSSLKLLPMASC